MGRGFEIGHLVPEAALAEEIAVVGGENNHRVVKLAGGFQRIQQFPDEIIDIGNVGVIAMARGADIGFA